MAFNLTDGKNLVTDRSQILKTYCKVKKCLFLGPNCKAYVPMRKTHMNNWEPVGKCRPQKNLTLNLGFIHSLFKDGHGMEPISVILFGGKLPFFFFLIHLALIFEC